MQKLTLRNRIRICMRLKLTSHGKLIYLCLVDLSKSFLYWLCQYLSFLQYFFNNFFPMEKCGVTLHCFYRDLLTLISKLFHIDRMRISNFNKKPLSLALRKRCPYSELFWSVIRSYSELFWEMRSISLYSVRMRKNADHNNFEYGHFTQCCCNNGS